MLFFPGCLYLLDWTTGLDYWTGLLDWTTGLTFLPLKITFNALETPFFLVMDVLHPS